MNDRGFALLSLMLVIAAAGGAFLVGLQRIEPPDRGGGVRVDTRLARIRRAAEGAFLATGGVPADLDALGAATALPPGGSWRVDPFGAGDLAYTMTGTPSILTVTSRGRDLTLATSDDVLVTVDSTLAGRARSRNRLRIIRAAFLRSAYMYTGVMALADVAAMRSHVREYAIAQRSIVHAANSTGRAALVARRDAASTAVESLRAVYSLPMPPVTVTGPGGLLSELGVPDSHGIDGFGRPLISNTAVGCTCVGGDGTGGTDDDL